MFGMKSLVEVTNGMMHAVVGPDVQDLSESSEDDSTAVVKYESTDDFYYLPANSQSVEYLDEIFTDPDRKRVWTDIASQSM